MIIVSPKTILPTLTAEANARRIRDGDPDHRSPKTIAMIIFDFHHKQIVPHYTLTADAQAQVFQDGDDDRLDFDQAVQGGLAHHIGRTAENVLRVPTMTHI